MSNAITEDDMSSGQTTDVSRTSSYRAQGSFDDMPGPGVAGSGAVAVGGQYLVTGGATGATSAAARPLGAPIQGGPMSSLAEHLARAEDKVGRGYEKGLLYRQGPEGVAAAVAGEEIPVAPPVATGSTATAAGAGAGVAMGSGAGAIGARGAMGAGVGVRGRVIGARGGEEGKVESLADMLAKADDGPGNLKELFQEVRLVGGGRKCH